ncbi:MAG: methyltransferase [Acidobacteriaceae bacterium]|jgi:protein-S-isoprenylcysteine O-methyltransferase Ste14
MKLNLITLAMLLVGVVWACLYAPSVEWNAVRIVGAAIAIVSLALLVVARLQLGAAFSVQAKAKTLVTTGLYSRIRNPIYVFSAMFLVGIVIVSERWLLLLLMAALVPMQMVRARKEAQVLAEAFGEEYARYKARTWF